MVTIEVAAADLFPLPFATNAHPHTRPRIQTLPAIIRSCLTTKAHNFHIRPKSSNTQDHVRPIVRSIRLQPLPALAPCVGQAQGTGGRPPQAHDRGQSPPLGRAEADEAYQ